jgi:hypothetical protein
MIPSNTKNVASDYKLSQQLSISSNNLLKPDNNSWNNENELLRIKSQSISNIAGKNLFLFNLIQTHFFFRNCY